MRRIILEITALILALCVGYIYFHQDEAVGIAVENYLDTHDFITIK